MSIFDDIAAFNRDFNQGNSMGYSTNPDVLEARKHLLTDLAAGNPAAWTVTGGYTGMRKFIDKIREALYIASLYPDKYPDLARAREMFSLHMIRDKQRIEARYKIQPSVVPAEPEHGITTGPLRPVPQVGLSSAAQCIETWNLAQPSNDPVLLANTTLAYPELLKLHAWCTRHTPKLMMLVGDGHITLSLYEAEVAALAAWSPNPEPTIEEEFDL